MSKDKKKKIEEVKDENTCRCSEGKECTCGDNCNCGDSCTCNDECNCSEECNCDESCECGEDCSCHHDDHDTDELLSKRIKDLEDALLRSQAELINYKKRKDEETDRIIKYAEEDILKGFLPILDNFERAINMDDDNLDDEVSKFLKGFKLMYNQIRELLSRFDVKEIDALNKEFDPAIHNAVMVDKKEGVKSGVVTEVLQKGYMYKDRVLRTSMVKVNE